MKEFTLFRTLKSRLIFWFAAICIVPLLLVTSIIYFQRAEVLRGLISDKLSAVTSLRQDQINFVLDNMVMDTTTLAHGKTVREAAITLLKKAPAAGKAPELNPSAIIKAYKENYSAVIDISIVAGNGTILLSTNKGKTGSSVASPAIVASALRANAPALGDVYLSNIDKVVVMDVAAPIWSGGAKIDAALVIRYDFQNMLGNIMENRTGMGKTGESLLVNRDVVPITVLRSLPGAAFKIKIKGRPAMLAAQGQTGIAETIDYRGEKVLAAYT
ncbi:MAG: cache domain-containing protein, partial [Deltaproteobacteria bacterium]